jgi:hypothetical protein
MPSPTTPPETVRKRKGLKMGTSYNRFVKHKV